MLVWWNMFKYSSKLCFESPTRRINFVISLMKFKKNITFQSRNAVRWNTVYIHATRYNFYISFPSFACQWTNVGWVILNKCTHCILLYAHKYAAFKKTRNHRLRNLHFSAGMLVWWNLCTVRAAAYIAQTPNPRYKFCVKFAKRQNNGI